MLGFLFSRFYLFAIAELDKYTIQRTGMPAVSLVLEQLAIQLTDTDVGVAAVIVPDPPKFFLSVCLRMPAMGTM
jgi:hypothetical protein